jgi:predicted CoA-substrate-specific enzyme activase
MMDAHVVGVDVGAMTVKAALLNGDGELLADAYQFHRGNPLATLPEVIEQVADGVPLRFVLTGSSAKLAPVRDGVPEVNGVQATIAAVQQRYPDVRNILDIGGASLTLVRLDRAGRFRGFSANSQCAAGTGSFLDEQLMRLGMTYDEIAGLDEVEAPPAVATRCAVFAKSDLIHLQQVGASKQEMWSGLCRGMSQTALQTLLKGKPLSGLTVLVGGVAQNPEVVRWLRDLSETDIRTDDLGHISGAIGAGLVALRDGEIAEPIQWREWLDENAERSTTVSLDVLEDAKCFSACPPEEEHVSHFAEEHADEPLELKRTDYPSFEVEESYTDDLANEVRISRWPEGDVVRGALGIDIGSTSTKLCLIDDDGEVLVDIYRKTGGDPIGATKKLLIALAGVAEKREGTLEVTSCGTTGSGRKLVGAVVGADAVVNEISAHVAGATHVDPEVETIFEIGGQDSKYMACRNGQIVDANMNYVCAAGTGSFVEEQARKLGVHLHDVGDLVLGIVPPPSSDRCTVFMEQDVNKLLRSGRTSAQALAAVMRSVVQNYLNKVVGNRHYSQTKIGFQGATARNKGLVAAFETLLGVEVVVSPYCHVMGAWGVALLTQARLRREQAATKFYGLDLSNRSVQIRKEPCELCNNECEITFAAIEGVDDEPSWGYVCGRDPDEERMRVLREYDLFKKRDRWLKQMGKAPRASKQPRHTVGIPRALAAYSHYPMWRRLLEELGCKVKLTGETTRDTRELGAALTGAEFCFPVKVAHGQAAGAASDETLDFVFVPHMVAAPPAGRQSNTYLCTYVQAFPAVVRTALQLAGYDESKVLAPIIDRRLSEHRQIRNVTKVLSKPLRVSESKVRKAYRAAVAAQDEFEARCAKAGLEMLDKIASDHETGTDKRPAIVIIGRPYNVNDAGINLDLPRKIAEMGYRVIPIDFLPYDPERIHPKYRNTFWAYGQRILAALELVREREDLFPIYFTNFNCGPDSFLLSYAEETMGDKPMLMLELDEHGADAGYITRIEAFLDVVRGWQPKTRERWESIAPDAHSDLKQRRIWLPAMHPVTSDLFAAAFRGEGYDAIAIPPETRKDLEAGQQMTRGCECLPMRVTVGSFLNATKDQPGKHALFMPTAKGPCRFGQYVTLHREILDRSGHADTTIVSPSSDNAYSGMSEQLRRRFWKSMLFGDMLYKMALRVRPYERTPGDTDAMLDTWIKNGSIAFENGEDPKPVLTEAGEAFMEIPMRDEKKPLVGVVGEIFVRNNEFSNENVIRAIEAAGGEAWMAPVSEWILFTAAEDVRNFVDLPKTFKETLNHGKRIIKSRWLQREEEAYHHAAGAIVTDREEPNIQDDILAGRRYLPFNVGGEVLLTLGRAVHFVRQGAALIVNCSPFSCMAGTVGASLFSRFEEELRVPVVNLFYEGTGDENRRLEVFLANLDPSDSRSGPPKKAERRKGMLFPFVNFGRPAGHV